MDRKITLRTSMLVLAAVLIGFMPGFAQQPGSSDVKIEVRKLQSGQLNVEQENTSVEEIGDLQELLRKHGVAEELQDLQPGEELEIIIRRKRRDDVVREMVIDLEPAEAPAPPVAVEAPKPPLLGVYYHEDIATGGGKVSSVMESSAADVAGIEVADIIIQLDGEVIQGLSSLQKAVASHEAGDKVKVVILRNGEKVRKNVTLGVNDRKDIRGRMGGRTFDFNDFDNLPQGVIIDSRRSRSNGQAKLGVSLNVSRTMIEDSEGNVTDKSTASVQGVLPGSVASEMGIMTGDEIKRVNGKRIEALGDIRGAMGKTKAGDDLEIVVLRNGTLKQLKGTVKASPEGEVEERIDVRFNNNINIEKDVDQIRFFKDRSVTNTYQGDLAPGEVREFRMTVTVTEVNSEEAEALSARSGEEFSGQSNLKMARFEVGPNPSNGMFSLSFDLPTQGMTSIRVLDLNGEEIYSEKMGMFSGTYNRDFDISNFSKGVYFLQINQGDQAFTKKVVTQ